MHGRLRGALAALVPTLVLVLTPAAAAAQWNPIELGIDAAVTWSRADQPGELGPTWLMLIQIPAANVRVGIMSADRRWSVEPNLSFTHFSSGGNRNSATVLDLGLLYHFGVGFARQPEAPQPYIRPFVGLDYATFLGDDTTGTDARSRYGVGLGVKLRMAERLATRLEARYVRARGSENRAATNSIGMTVGLSFFTR
jgi:hypothetical protein